MEEPLSEADWERLRSEMSPRQFEFYRFVYQHQRMEPVDLDPDDDHHGPIPLDIHEVIHNWMHQSMAGMMDEVAREALERGGMYDPLIQMRAAEATKHEGAAIACGAFGLGVLWGQRQAVMALEQAESAFGTPPGATPPPPDVDP